ncbi:hypothetical protein NQ317_013481 [Molorchus minor]|uniref:Uncharacterized protein n=1 Tax=Molorchus minor TaxID=1323400 RepID=A0ABQ9JA14_9CUCU|nr:hypothetical protein NQ317_013481 [Molorchus minor]
MAFQAATNKDGHFLPVGICVTVCQRSKKKLPNNISINSHKKHGRWNEKMAETGQEEGKQNIRIEGALLLIQYKRQ